MSLSTQRNDGDTILSAKLSSSIQSMESSKELVQYLMVKRALDIVLAALGLICLTPVFLIVAILIKLEDPRGPIFFGQIRVGKDEKPFRMYKFRSMVSNAEELLHGLLKQNEIHGAMFKMKADPRITRVGKFIRKTSIDELPQLWNVIIGDMSIVGPRPPLPREVAEYTSYDKLRLKAMPGCTGLWQISGRNELSFDEMVELDLVYIEQRSMFVDFKIMFKTFRLLLGAKDAF